MNEFMEFLVFLFGLVIFLVCIAMVIGLLFYYVTWVYQLFDDGFIDFRDAVQRLNPLYPIRLKLMGLKKNCWHCVNYRSFGGCTYISECNGQHYQRRES